MILIIDTFLSEIEVSKRIIKNDAQIMYYIINTIVELFVWS